MDFSAAEETHVAHAVGNQGSEHAGAPVDVDSRAGGDAKRIARKAMEPGSEIHQVLMLFQVLQHLGRRTVGVGRTGEKVEIMENVAVYLDGQIARAVERESQAFAIGRRSDAVAERTHAAGVDSIGLKAAYAHFDGSPVEIEICHRGEAHVMARIDHLVDLDGIGVDPNPGAVGLTHLHGKIGGDGHPLGGGIGGDSGTGRCESESESRQNGGK